jgi:hypothetical protein
MIPVMPHLTIRKIKAENENQPTQLYQRILCPYRKHPSALISLRMPGGNNEYDLVVYGATSGGIVAAVQAARMGLSVILVEPSGHLGWTHHGRIGKDRFGKGRCDRREYRANFTRGCGNITKMRMYGSMRSSSFREGDDAIWDFEPSVALMIYRQMLEEAGVPVVMGDRLILSAAE